ncbi:unnamed protein product [Mytilus coruscus]|uniref:Uncharacterized protein n=1 Tax=Mytilus coruscus TaxID=42192 RepID=A0A6J8DYR6_MYTCO|nr:unnamed protein product [Mytilus coruscus]
MPTDYGTQDTALHNNSPKKLEDRRRKLYLVMKEAKRNSRTTTLVRDRLFINELYRIRDEVETAEMPYQGGSLPTRQGGSSPPRQRDATPQRLSYATPQRQSDATPPRIEQTTSTPSSDSSHKKRSWSGSTPKGHYKNCRRVHHIDSSTRFDRSDISHVDIANNDVKSNCNETMYNEETFEQINCILENYLRLQSNALIINCNDMNGQSRQKINKWDHKKAPEFRTYIKIDRLDRLLRNLKNVNLENVDNNNVNAFVNVIGIVVLESAKTTFGMRTDKPKRRALKTRETSHGLIMTANLHGKTLESLSAGSNQHLRFYYITKLKILRGNIKKLWTKP